MKKEEMQQQIQAIGTCEDDATRRNLLAQFQTDLEKDYDVLSNAQTQNATYQSQIDKLQKDNMALFLQVTNRDVEPNKPTENQNLKFEDLFNEKGELK